MKKAAVHISTKPIAVASKPRDNHAPKRREDVLSEPLGGFISVKTDGNSHSSRRNRPAPRRIKTIGKAGVALQTNKPRKYSLGVMLSTLRLVLTSSVILESSAVPDAFEDSMYSSASSRSNNNLYCLSLSCPIDLDRGIGTFSPKSFVASDVEGQKGQAGLSEALTNSPLQRARVTIRIPTTGAASAKRLARTA